MLAFYLAMIDKEADRFRFEKIYRSYRKQMFLTAKAILLLPEDAEDAVQNALLAIAQTIRKLPPMDDAAVRAYVLVAARNHALNLRRKNKRNTVPLNEQLPAESMDVFDRIILKCDYEALCSAMRKLAATYREILLLYYVQQLHTGEIARMLGRRKATVRKQLTRGRQQLLALCRKEGMNDAG